MIGFGPEDASYCLEVTYNYGVKKQYPADGSIQFFGIIVADVPAAVQVAKDLGYSADENNVITGPDGYPYKPLSCSSTDRSEPFAGVRLRVSSLENSVKFYSEVIGMSVISEEDVQVPVGGVPDGVKSAYVGFDKSQCLYQLVEFPEVGITVASGWQGRNALGPKDVTPVYQRHTERNGAILHEKRVLKEEPLMEIFIGQDPDGYELCLITHDQFSAEAASATNYKDPDWEKRDRYLKTHEWEFEAPDIASSNITAETK